MGRRSLGTIVPIGLFIIFFIVTLISVSFFTVDAREYAVVTQFGKPVATHTEPGLYTKLPSPIQSITRFDRRIQLYQTQLVEYLTGDRKNVIIQSYTCWRITDPLEFFRSVRTTDIAERRIDDVVASLIGSTLGDYEMANLFSTESEQVKVEEIEQTIQENANTKLAKNYGIEIVSMGICRIALPDENARSVYSRMEAERNTIAAQYRAEGREQATIIRAEADREQSDILSEAYREAETLRGEGEARAAEIYAQAYSRSPEFFDLIRTLNAYKAILTENTTIVLSAESELFKYLNPPKGFLESHGAQTETSGTAGSE